MPAEPILLATDGHLELYLRVRDDDPEDYFYELCSEDGIYERFDTLFAAVDAFRGHPEYVGE